MARQHLSPIHPVFSHQPAWCLPHSHAQVAGAAAAGLPCVPCTPRGSPRPARPQFATAHTNKARSADGAFPVRTGPPSHKLRRSVAEQAALQLVFARAEAPIRRAHGYTHGWTHKGMQTGTAGTLGTIFARNSQEARQHARMQPHTCASVQPHTCACAHADADARMPGWHGARNVVLFLYPGAHWYSSQARARDKSTNSSCLTA